MHVLLYKDTDELVAIFESHHSAIACAQFLSREKQRPIIVVNNDETGGTERVLLFEHGEEVTLRPPPSPSRVSRDTPASS